MRCARPRLTESQRKAERARSASSESESGAGIRRPWRGVVLRRLRRIRESGGPLASLPAVESATAARPVAVGRSNLQPV